MSTVQIAIYCSNVKHYNVIQIIIAAIIVLKPKKSTETV